MRFEERGIRAAAAKDSEVVAFATGDLRVEDTVERGRQVVAGAHIVNDLFGITHPVEIAPDFAAVDDLGTLFRRQGAHRLDGGHGHADVGVVFVGGIVGVNHARAGGAQHFEQVVAQRGAVRVLNRGARVVELDHRSELANGRSEVLFLAANCLHLVIGKLRVGTGARTAGAIGAGHPGEPLAVILITGENAVEGHELEVVLVGADAEMGDARQSRGFGKTVGDEKFSGGLVQFHGQGALIFGRLAAATAWPTRRLFSSGRCSSILPARSG